MGVPKKMSPRAKLWHVHNRLPRHGINPRQTFDVLPQKVSKPVPIYSMRMVSGWIFQCYKKCWYRNLPFGLLSFSQCSD